MYGGYLLAGYDDDDEVYQTICKIGTGFNDEALKTLTEQMKPHIIDAPPGYYSYGDGPNVTPDVWFSPETVWEVMAADLSARMKMLAPSDAFRIRSVVEKAGLPTMPPLQVVDQLRDLMSRDKKASDAGLRLILVQSIGEAVVVPDVPEALIAETISAREALCGG